MAAKKSSGLPKALTQAKYTEAVLERLPPNYPDPGVEFAGYAKIPVSGGWRLLKQYAFTRLMMTQNDNVDYALADAKGYVTYITSMQIGAEATDAVFGFYLKDLTNGTGPNIWAWDGAIAKSVFDQHTQSKNETVTFNPPLKVNGTVLRLSGFGTATIYVNIRGFIEERA